MALNVKVKSQIGKFVLDVTLTSHSKRIGILGASGCGKSMTLKSIAGIQKVDEGIVAVEDEIFFDSSKRIDKTPQQRRIGYLFQNYALFPKMTVKQNIMAGLKGKRIENEARANEMISKFQLIGMENHYPNQLSGGQQQRTALARIMAYQPPVILLDEPFSALDRFLSEHLRAEMLEMLEDYDGTVILVSHNRDEIYQFSEELFVMEDGRIILQGETKNIFKNPQVQSAARLTGCENIAKIQRIDDKKVYIPEWDCLVETERMIPPEITLIGYRASEFCPIWGEKEKNCIAFREDHLIEIPFERQYFIQGNQKETICWSVPKNQWTLLDEKGRPDFLQIQPQELLWLKA